MARRSDHCSTGRASSGGQLQNSMTRYQSYLPIGMMQIGIRIWRASPGRPLSSSTTSFISENNLLYFRVFSSSIHFFLLKAERLQSEDGAGYPSVLRGWLSWLQNPVFAKGNKSDLIYFSDHDFP